MKKLILIALLVISCELKKEKGVIISHNETKKIEMKGTLNDFEQLFSQTEKTEISNLLSNYSDFCKNKIIVFTIDNLYGFKDYTTLGNALYNEWQIKNKEQNHTNQFLIIVSKEKRKFSITIGDDLKNEISDEMINEIIGNKVIPFLQNEDYFEGVIISIKELIKLDCNTGFRKVEY